MPQPQLGPPNTITVKAIDGQQSTLVFTGMIIQTNKKIFNPINVAYVLGVFVMLFIGESILLHISH